MAETPSSCASGYAQDAATAIGHPAVSADCAMEDVPLTSGGQMILGLKTNFLRAPLVNSRPHRECARREEADGRSISSSNAASTTPRGECLAFGSRSARKPPPVRLGLSKIDLVPEAHRHRPTHSQTTATAMTLAEEGRGQSWSKRAPERGRRRQVGMPRRVNSTETKETKDMAVLATFPNLPNLPTSPPQSRSTCRWFRLVDQRPPTGIGQAGRDGTLSRGRPIEGQAG